MENKLDEMIDRYIMMLKPNASKLSQNTSTYKNQ